MISTSATSLTVFLCLLFIAIYFFINKKPRHSRHSRDFKDSKDSKVKKEDFKQNLEKVEPFKDNIKNLKLGPFFSNVSNITHGVINNAESVKRIQPTSQRLYVYNPSIAYDNHGDIVGVSRMTGKIAKECTYFKDSDFKDNENVSAEIGQYKPKYTNDLSTVVMWKLRDLPNFKVIPMFSSENICDGNDYLETSQGVEDPRLFRFRGQLWIYAHFRGFLGECTHAPIIMPAKEPYDHFDQKSIIKLHTDKMRWVEKNWMPFEYEGDLYFVYDISPHIILKCDLSTGYCRVVYKSDNIQYDVLTRKHLGGGAPGVKFMLKGNPYFITIAHTRENTPTITRKNFFYVFRGVPPFDIVMIGSEFDIMEEYRAIEFGSGLVLSEDAKKITITAGISDCYSVLCDYNLVDVLSTLRHVGEL
jgi:hypothetical protein